MTDNGATPLAAPAPPDAATQPLDRYVIADPADDVQALAASLGRATARNEALTRACNLLLAERDAARGECDAIAAERDAAIAERDAAQATLEGLAS
jgi:cell division septum initiation protein DivIVA